jgi:hypothetical protein
MAAFGYHCIVMKDSLDGRATIIVRYNADKQLSHDHQ